MHSATPDSGDASATARPGATPGLIRILDHPEVLMCLSCGGEPIALRGAKRRRLL